MQRSIKAVVLAALLGLVAVCSAPRADAQQVGPIPGCVISGGTITCGSSSLTPSATPCTTTALSLQYNSAGAFGCVSGWTTNGTTALTGGAGTSVAIGGATIGSNALAVTGSILNSMGTITTSQPITRTATWNAGGVTFDEFVQNVTYTAAVNPSYFYRAQIAGSDRIQFSVPSSSGNGTITVLSGTSGRSGVYGAGSASWSESSTAVRKVYIEAASKYALLASDSTISWSNNTDAPSGTVDLNLYRDAANTLALRNSTTAQAFNIYNTYTDASNYERLGISWATTANQMTIQPAHAGTGTVRTLQFAGDGATTAGAIALFAQASANPIIIGNTGTNWWQFSSGGHFLAVTDNTYDIGANGATRPRDIYAAGKIVLGSLVQANGASGIGFTSRSFLTSASDGVLMVSNNASTDFTRLQFGGTTSSFPALARSTTTLSVLLADGTSGGTLAVTGSLTNAGITTDATHTDSTVCQDTTTHQFYFGSGALGVCLGTSGRQFKTEITPMVAGLDDLMKVDFINYRYRTGYGDGGARKQYGTTAQNVEAAIPDLARQNANGETINFDSGALLFVGLRAIQQLKAENDNIKASNDNLRAEIETLKRASR